VNSLLKAGLSAHLRRDKNEIPSRAKKTPCPFYRTLNLFVQASAPFLTAIVEKRSGVR
jgi:hypothetical protein